ncbi:MAG: ACT domain-containing protein [Oscillospiraceae bacterium]|jgi:hypothetical protein|nr:ACT domain-containing protein [Oscillospiraceae bacterium]
MAIHQISVFVENKAGTLSEITGVLAGAGIEIRALSIADTTDFGILRLIVNEPDKALDRLRAAGLTVSRTEVIAVCLEDHTGALHGVLETLNQAGIAVEYAYAFITRKSDAAYVILRVEDNECASVALRKAGVGLLSAEDVYSL